MVLGFLGVVPQRLRELVFFWFGLMKNGGSCRSTERKWPKDNKLETLSEVCVFRFVLASLGNTPSRDLRWAERAEGQGGSSASGVNFFWLELITVARYCILYCVLSLNSLPVHFFMGLLVWVPTTDLSIDMLMSISIIPRFWPQGISVCRFLYGCKFRSHSSKCQGDGLQGHGWRGCLLPKKQPNCISKRHPTSSEGDLLRPHPLWGHSSDFGYSTGCMTLPCCCRDLLIYLTRRLGIFLGKLPVQLFDLFQNWVAHLLVTLEGFFLSMFWKHPLSDVFCKHLLSSRLARFRMTASRGC